MQELVEVVEDVEEEEAKLLYPSLCLVSNNLSFEFERKMKKSIPCHSELVKCACCMAHNNVLENDLESGILTLRVLGGITEMVFMQTMSLRP